MKAPGIRKDSSSTGVIDAAGATRRSRRRRPEAPTPAVGAAAAANDIGTRSPELAREDSKRVARPHRGLLRSIDGAVGLVCVLEFLTVLGIGVLLMWGMGADEVPASGYVLASLFCAATLVMMLDYQRLYGPAVLIDPRHSIGRIASAVLVAFGALVITGCASSGHLSYDLSWLVAFVGATILTLGLGRFLVGHFLAGPATRDLFTRNVIIIGAGACGLQLLRQLESGNQPWIRVLGMFDDRARGAGGRVPRSIEGVRVLGNARSVLTFSRRMRVDDIVVALPWSAHARIREIVRAAESISANIHLANDTLASSPRDRGQSLLDGFPALRVSRKPLSGWSYVLKRATDVIGALVGLVLLAPLMLLIAAGIKLQSRGPVFFKQPRYGINGRTIHVLKFRSMYHEQRDLLATRLVTRDDPRVTPFGRFLRRSSLDELPQLLNVLIGEMSLVGPRPHAKNAKAAGRVYQEVVAEYGHRHRIKPGITGWAQINGWRGETDTDEKIIRRCEHDLHYINNASFFLDVYIVFATVLRVPFQRNVY
jgi:Undecaprenyl-phosphate glucose phosphotransferase